MLADHTEYIIGKGFQSLLKAALEAGSSSTLARLPVDLTRKPGSEACRETACVR